MAGSRSDPDSPPAVLITAGEDLLDKARAVADGILGRVLRAVEQDDPALLPALGEPRDRGEGSGGHP
jgi:hypothetical protein